MAYTLYNRPGSGGFAVEAALTLIGAPFDYVDIGNKPGEETPESFRAINPWGQVPALILPDGSLMTETGAILIYLASAHPEAGLGPTPGSPAYGNFLRWITFLGANIYEGVLRDGYPHRFTDDPGGLAEVRSAAIRRTREGLSLLEAGIGSGGWLQDDMSMADIYLAMLFIWCRERRGLPKIEALTHRIAAHQVIAPVWRRNFDHRQDIKWGR